MKLFDKLGRLLTKTSLDAEITTDGEPRIRISAKSIQKVLEDIRTELKLHRTLIDKKKQGVILIDENGAEFGVSHTLNELHVENTPEGWEIARGNVAGKTPIHILGNNDDTSTSFEDMWEAGGLYVLPAAGGIQMEVRSTGTNEANDTADGTGVQQVMIHYLDGGYVERFEFVEMNGATPVDTVATDILRVQNMHSSRVGSGGVAAETISLEDTTSAVEYTRIRAGINTSLTGVWTVPINKTLYITEWETAAIATNANRTAEFFLRATSSFHGDLLPGIFNVKDISHLTSGQVETFFDLPLKIPSKADVKVTVSSSAAMECACHIEGWYENEK